MRRCVDARSRDVDWLDDAYVLCEDGVIAAVGRMRDLPALDGDVVELDGSGHCAIPGLVDCHTHPCFAGDRVEEFSLRAAGASYEELHAEGGGILSTVRATRAASEDELARAVRRHAEWMLRAGTTTFEGKSGYGLDRDTELASLRAVKAAGGVPTWLGAHAVPPEFDDADAYLDFALAEVLPEALRESRRRLMSSSSAARSMRSRRAAISRRVETPGSHCASTATSSASPEPFRSRSSSGHAPSTIWRRPERTARTRSRAPRSSACCSP